MAKNSFLLEEGKMANHTHYLEEGFVRTYTHDSNGNDITTGLYPGNCFANDLSSFFKRIPSQESHQAMTDCKLWTIDYAGVQELFHTIPEFREFGRMMLINNYVGLKTRTIGMIQHTAEQRYDQLMTTMPEVFQFVPLKHIATYLGITDTSLSRIRRDYR
jgi:CRP-like cAMP-binding protein